MNITVDKPGLTEDTAMTDTLELLQQLGITANYNGFWYIQTAMEIVDLRNARSIRVTKDLYPKIAERHGTSTQNVERGIRTVIASCWDYGNRELLIQITASNQKPTNAVFIASLAAYLYLKRSYGATAVSTK